MQAGRPKTEVLRAFARMMLGCLLSGRSQASQALIGEIDNLSGFCKILTLGRLTQ